MQRNGNHRIDSRAQKIFNYETPDYWSVGKPEEDYGLDYLVQVFDNDEIGEARPILFYIQLKGTTNYRQDAEHVKFRMDIEYLKYIFTKIPVPVFLVVVDVNTEDYCWLFLQEYINEELKDEELWESQKSVTLNIPKGNTFSNPKIIEKCASEGLQYCNILVNGIPDYKILYKLEKILEEPSDKMEFLENDFSRMLKEEINVSLDLITEKNNLAEAKKNLLKVYRRTIDDEENILNHLKSIVILLTLHDYRSSEERELIFKYVDEGLNLAKEHDITSLIAYFNGCDLENNCHILQDKLSDLLSVSEIIDTPLFSDANEQYLKHKGEIYSTVSSIEEIFDKLSRNITSSLENENLFVTMELITMLIELELKQIQIMEGFEDESFINTLFNHVEELITSYGKITQMSEDFYDECNLLQFQAVFYCLKGDDKCLDIVNNLIEKCKNNGSKFHENKAKTLKKDMDKQFYLIKQENSQKTEEIMQGYEQLLSYINENFSEDDEYAIPIRQGIKDINPERVLKNCANLELAYKHAGLYNATYGLYSAGMKIIYCKRGGMKSGSDLDEVYDEFSNEFCQHCEHKISRDMKWEYGDTYVESAEFREMLKSV